jgi:predicted anti-sigma-YlaC factor YlaD
MSERYDSSQHSSHADRSHAEVHSALPSYASAMALGQAPEIRYPDVAAHLHTCPACRAELDELAELVMPAYRGQVAPAASYPEFDLSFLRPSEPRPSWFIDSLRRLVVQFSEPLLVSLRQTTYAQAVRGPAIYHYAPEPAPSNLGLTIDVFADERVADQGNVQVLLDLPSRDPLDQSGLLVNLRVGDLLWEGTTSTTGSVTFASVPLKDLARLRIEIALPQDS